MNINFIVTAFNREQYLPIQRKILGSYERIKPTVALCYNGSDPKFPADVRTRNRGHQEGDYDLTVLGLDYLRQRNDCRRFIKIGIDTFLLNEAALMNIFWEMEQSMCCYAGNHWGSEEEPSYATDIIFLDALYGDPLKDMDIKDGASYEWWMFNSIKNKGLKAMMIQDRVPVHPNNRHECAALHWTMHHELEKNIENIRRWDYGSLIV